MPFQETRKENNVVFEKLYNELMPRLFFFVNQYLQDYDLAKETVQDCFLELWDKFENLNKEENLNAWLYTVAKNKSLKILSKKSSEKKYINQEEALATNFNMYSLSEFDTEKIDPEYITYRLKKALQKLSKPVQKVFIKRRFEGKTNKEVAEELKITIKTVEAHITKALKHLREELKDLH